MTERQVGRPKGERESQVRQKLIEVARPLFAERGYNQVSTRAIAAAADTNISMIRYYFGNKAGLFEACINEFYQPLLATLEQMANQQDTDVEQFILCYYQMVAKLPNWPQMITTSMNLDSGTDQRQAVDRAMAKPQQLLFKLVKRDGVLQPGINPNIAAHTILATILFPFMLPASMRERTGLSFDPQSLTNLAKHQAQILRSGLLAENK